MIQLFGSVIKALVSLVENRSRKRTNYVYEKGSGRAIPTFTVSKWGLGIKQKTVVHKSKQKLFHSLVRKAFISFRCLDAFDPDTCSQFFNDTFINFSLIYKLKNYCAKVVVEYFETVGWILDRKTTRPKNYLEPHIPYA